MEVYDIVLYPVVPIKLKHEGCAFGMGVVPAVNTAAVSWELKQRDIAKPMEVM